MHRISVSTLIRKHPFCRGARRQAGLSALLIVAGILPFATAVKADDAPPGDRIIGEWLVDSRDATVEIRGHGTGKDRHYEGRLVWLKDDRYHPEDGPKLAGKPVMDLHNPDPAKRHRTLLGMQLLWDLKYRDGYWQGGRVYNADSGHTYDCTVHLVDQDHLRLHGYVGIPLFGGSTVWTRLNWQPPQPLNPDEAPPPAVQQSGKAGQGG
jgi:uncharacterized protein (DUF2147 family)